jgi:3-dehydrotetronate 4-kinase
MQRPAAGPVLIYSSADPADVAKVQAAYGRERAGHMIESVLADAADDLAARGFSRFIVAGGETSGAVVTKLGVRQIEIGPEIAPGVPWTRSAGARPLVMALKSGNFGGPQFFIDAWKLLT